ncbi:hypothetical protein, partial [Salinispora arenicola]|uniref:hypothetical protein n=1 Tax=Salinispora arenicola TaxID=168697 RepID=UPI000575E526
VQRSDLRPGVTIYRITDQTDAGTFAPLPCHEDQAVKLPVTAAVVVCRLCSQSYEAVLEADYDDGYGEFSGYTARYEVRRIPVLLSRTRRT